MTDVEFRRAQGTDLPAIVSLLADDALGRQREDAGSPLDARYVEAFRAIARCREKGCTLVQLTTDRERPDAHRFYERLGFVASHVGYKPAL